MKRCVSKILNLVCNTAMVSSSAAARKPDKILIAPFFIMKSDRDRQPEKWEEKSVN